MIANMNKSNTGKLLVAVLALAMVISGCAIVFSEEADAEGNVAKIGTKEYSTLENAVLEATEGQTIELIQNASVSTSIDIENSVTIDAETFTITLSDGAKITSTDKTGRIIADGSVGNAVIASYGTNITIENVSISISSQTKGDLRPIINWNSFDDTKNLTVRGVDFNADENSKVNGNFSALSLNNYLQKGTAYINDCKFNGGMIGVSAGCKIDIKLTNDVVLNFYGKTGTFNLSEMLTIDTPAVLKTIIGWAGSPAGATNTSNITVNVDKAMDLGQLVAGAGVNNTASEKLNVNINENATAYDGTGIDILTIAKEKTFTVKEGETYNGVSITGAGSLISKGATINSDITVSGNVTMDGIAIGNDLIAIEGDVLAISGNGYLTEDLVIPSGKTLRMVSGSILEMNGHSITIQNSGTLQVEYGAVIKSNGSDNEVIKLDRNAVIDNQGTIGYGVNPVTVQVLNDANASYSGKGSVEMQNVSGVVLSVVNSGETTGNPAKPVYILAVSGSVYAEDDSKSTFSLSIKDARITGDMIVGQGVILNTYDSNKVYIGNATLTVDGTLVADGLVMQNGSTVNLNGVVTGKITAETGDYAVNSSSPTLVDTTVELKPKSNFNLVGLTLSVGQINYVDDSGSTPVTMISQRLYLEGTVTGVYTGESTEVPELRGAEITVTNPEGGKSYIAADTVLSLGTGIKMVGSGTVVLGQIQYVDSSLAADGFVGTQYRVDATGANGAKTVTYYIEPFDAAYANIANAYQTTINVYGNLTISINVDLQAKQKIMINGSVTIAEDNTVTVRSQASIGQIYDVQGTMVKYNGGSCPVPTNYVVEKKGDGYTSWSGLGPAIAGAQPGDVIDVKKNGTVSNDMTVPAGVTLNIESGATLKFQKDLTIAETAKLVNEGGIEMAGEKSKINVDGELVSVDGTISFTKAPAANKADSRAINANGTAILDLNKITVTGSGDELTFADVINGAAYLNNDMQTVVTTIPSAITGVESTDAIQKTITVYGNINDSTDITLGSSTALVISEGAEAVLGNISMTPAESGDGSNVVATNGKLTAIVSGTNGTVSLDGASGVSIGMSTYTSADNVKTNYVVFGGILVGKATIESGIVNAASLVVDGTKTSLTVASGSTLAVEDIAGTPQTLTVGASGTEYDSAALIVDGTLLFDGGELESVTYMDGNDNKVRQSIQINGEMILADEADVDGILYVAGSLEISTTEDSEAILNVSKYIVVGTEPISLGVGGSVVGQVQLVSNAFVLAYAGADVSGMTINPDANGSTGIDTEYYVNETLYMTAYAARNVGASISSVLAVPSFEIPGYETEFADDKSIRDLDQWKTIDGESPDGNIGSIDAVYIDLAASKAKVQISVGTGISVYIDGIKYLSGSDPDLGVGIHKIEVSVDPGFNGSTQITFNGDIVSGESFTITPEMAGTTVVLTVTGDITADTPTINVPGSSSGDEMGLTDYLLIILVILIVIMAIMVAFRLMRS